MFKRFFIHGSGRYLVLLPIPLAWIIMGAAGSLQSLRDLASDWRFRLRREIPSPVNLVYVDIDSRAINELGNFPWNHDLFERVCQGLLTDGGVKAIGIDVVMSSSGVPNVVDRAAWNKGHNEFGKFLFNGAPVVMAGSYAGKQDQDADGKRTGAGFPLLENGDVENAEPPETAEWTMRSGAVLNPPLVGLIDTMSGETNTVPLFAPLPGRTLYHMGLELARLQLGLERDNIRIFDDHIELQSAEGDPVLTVPLRKRQLMDINWFSKWIAEQNPRVSFYDALLAKARIDSDDPELQAKGREFFDQPGLKDSIVLIGPVDRLLQDLAPTPFDSSPVPKVGVHGNVLKTLLSGRFIRTLPRWSEAVIALALTGVVTGLVVFAGRRGLWSRVAALSVAGGYVAAVFVTFAKLDLILPMIVPVGSALSTSFLAVVMQLIIEEKQKGRIKGMFGTYVAPALVDRMIASGEEPKLGGVEADITAYFSDIRNFSTFSEKLTPPKLVELMNEYLTVCTDLVQAEGGTLDKYIGDAVVAIYGAPVPFSDHAYRACVSALTVHKRVAELRAKWEGEGDKWPTIVKQLQTRIGLNSGPAVVGNMGSATRFNYTMMGDTVNLGARMESGAKAYGVFTMVTEATKRGCEAVGGDRVVFRYLDRIQVKGRNQPVPIYEAVGFRADLPESTLQCVKMFEEAAELYHRQRWDEAMELFRRSADLEPNYPGITPGVQTNPSLVMVERSLFMKSNPPGPEWDGVFVMTSK